MLNCFLVEKIYLHYAVCDFDSILLHCTKLFIRQSIDREQIFDVTFEPPPIEKSCVRHCYHQLVVAFLNRQKFSKNYAFRDVKKLRKAQLPRIRRIVEKGLGHLFITLSSSHFLNKTDFKQYLFNC